MSVDQCCCLPLTDAGGRSRGRGALVLRGASQGEVVRRQDAGDPAARKEPGARVPGAVLGAPPRDPGLRGRRLGEEVQVLESDRGGCADDDTDLLEKGGRN